MANEDIKQRLTAILSADVKDYSRLLSQDRVGTINTLKSHRDLYTNFIQTGYCDQIAVISDISVLLSRLGSLIDVQGSMWCRYAYLWC